MGLRPLRSPSPHKPLTMIAVTALAGRVGCVPCWRGLFERHLLLSIGVLWSKLNSEDTERDGPANAKCGLRITWQAHEGSQSQLRAAALPANQTRRHQPLRKVRQPSQ
jgi:hypothetical protein